MDNKPEVILAKTHGKPVREWLLLQAQLQMDYASLDNAVLLLELAESVFGESLTSSLMLCKSWMRLNNREKLELKAKTLLVNPELSRDQMAVIYFCLSRVRWENNDHNAARMAYDLYASYVSEESDTQ